MSYGPAIFGLPHSDPFSTYIDREGDGQRHEEAAERRRRFGEVAGGQLPQRQPLTEAEHSRIWEEKVQREQDVIDFYYEQERQRRTGEGNGRAILLPTERELEQGE